jgi:hypothetical protein
MKQIILISHVPCSSGTFITSYIAKSFSRNPWIVPETNPYSFYSYSKKTFLPESPLFSLKVSGLISLETWLEEYKSQLFSLVRTWEMQPNSNLLVIRDHCFSEFFMSEKPLRKTPIIADILKENSIDFIPIFTHRDPIDTWLGFNASFPKQAENFTLETYSQKYLDTINTWRNTMKEKLIELKIEDIALNPESALNLIASQTQLSLENIGTKITQQDLGSGASGRKFSQPLIPPRRPYSFHALKSFRETDKFLELRQILEYPSMNNPTLADLCISLIHQVYQPLWRISFKNLNLKKIIGKINPNLAYF